MVDRRQFLKCPCRSKEPSAVSEGSVALRNMVFGSLPGAVESARFILLSSQTDPASDDLGLSTVLEN